MPASTVDTPYMQDNFSRGPNNRFPVMMSPCGSRGLTVPSQNDDTGGSHLLAVCDCTQQLKGSRAPSGLLLQEELNYGASIDSKHEMALAFSIASQGGFWQFMAVYGSGSLVTLPSCAVNDCAVFKARFCLCKLNARESTLGSLPLVLFDSQQMFKMSLHSEKWSSSSKEVPMSSNFVHMLMGSRCIFLPTFKVIRTYVKYSPNLAYFNVTFFNGLFGSRDKLMSRTIARKMVFGATLSKYDIFPCKWFGINVYDIFFRHIKQLEIPQLQGFTRPNLAILFKKMLSFNSEDERIVFDELLNIADQAAAENDLPHYSTAAPICAWPFSTPYKKKHPVLNIQKTCLGHSMLPKNFDKFTKKPLPSLRGHGTAINDPIICKNLNLAVKCTSAHADTLATHGQTKNVRNVNTYRIGAIIKCDSAGGNLVAGLTIKCLELGIRPPDGLYLAYTPFMFDLVPSPARLLAVMDPLLPLGFALRCLKAYASEPSNPTSEASSPVDPLSNRTTSSSIAVEVSGATLEQPSAGSDTESFVEVVEKMAKELPDRQKKAGPFESRVSPVLNITSLIHCRLPTEDSSPRALHPLSITAPRGTPPCYSALICIIAK
ncbi:unnamed protein product, partial [Meganyctiphanes norvegica]